MELIVNPSSTLSFMIQCRVRGQGPVDIHLPISSALPLDVYRTLFERLANHEGAAAPLELPDEVIEEFRDAGLLVAPDEAVASLPRFECMLNDTFPALMPGESSCDQASLVDAHDLVLAREFAWQEQGDGTTALSEAIPFAAALSAARPVLWVRDPGPRTWMPYHLDESLRKPVFDLCAGRCEAADLPRSVVRTLRLAGILAPRGAFEMREQQWRDTLSKTKEMLSREAFAVVRDFLNPMQLAESRRYYRALHRAAAFYPPISNDACVDQRDWIHNEEVSRFLHHQLLWTVNQLVPEEVRPSYAYLAVYHPGATLRRHIDRPQCQWNVSLVLDTEPEVNRASAWPIYLEVQGEAREVRLGMGDFVLYRGTDVPHWRKAQPEGCRSTIGFFHFVSMDFEGSLD
jgi:hypothetical protein